jgi:hypothetical protein
VAPEEAPQRAVAEPVPALPECVAQLRDGRVPPLLQQLQDQARRRLDAARAAVAAQRAGQDLAALALQGPPAADAGGTDAEPLRRLPMGRALGDRRQNAYPKINRQSL